MALDADAAAEPALRCRLCNQALEEALSTPCGHVFCAGCLLPWAARRRRRLCPLRCCHQPVTWQEEPLQAPPPLYPPRNPLERRPAPRWDNCGKRAPPPPPPPPPLPQRASRVEDSLSRPDRCGSFGHEGLLSPRMCGKLGPSGESAGQRGEQLRQRPGREKAGGEGSVGSCRHRGCPRAVAARRSAKGSRLENNDDEEEEEEEEKEVLQRWPCRQWSQREAALLSQLAALRRQVYLSALRYRQKVSQYLGHLGSLCPAGSPQRPRCRHREEESKILAIMLHRENNELGFNIVGGQLSKDNQEKFVEGIYVSRILENGPADKTDGMQINDRIIKVCQVIYEVINQEKWLHLLYLSKDGISACPHCEACTDRFSKQELTRQKDCSIPCARGCCLKKQS